MDALALLKQIETERLKHLVGRHDQKSHAGKRAALIRDYSVGTPGVYEGYRGATKENLLQPKYTGAIFVAQRYDDANVYASSTDNSEVYRVEVTTKKPFVLKGNEEEISAVTGTPTWSLQLNGLVVVRPELRKYLLANGYDSVITGGEGKYRPEPEKGNVIIALSPEQVKVTHVAGKRQPGKYAVEKLVIPEAL